MAHGPTLASTSRAFNCACIARLQRMKEESEEVVCEVLQYLIENPHAQDTVEGIAGWWISERTIRKGKELVEKALETLMAENLVIARKGRGTQTRYKINDQRREEIETFRHERCEDNSVASAP